MKRMLLKEMRSMVALKSVREKDKAVEVKELRSSTMR